MAKAEHAKKLDADAASIGVPLGSALIKEAELWMSAHSDFLTGMETMMTDWARRQRRAFDTSARSIRRIYDSRNVVDLVQAQSEWVSDCLELTASEIRAVGSDAATMTRKTAERLGEVARERSNGLRQQGGALAEPTAIPMQHAAE